MWLVSVFSISFITAIVEGDGLPGSGTAGDPYLIYTKDHLLNPLFEGQYEAMHVKLMDDIDFQGEHCPMLFWRWGFRGVFDGNNKKIKNIYMENQLGFIRLTIGNQTVVKNLTLVNPTLLIDEHLDPDDLQWGGLLIGYNSAGGIDCGAVIDNCHVINGDIQASVDFDPDNNNGTKSRHDSKQFFQRNGYWHIRWWFGGK